MNNQISSQKIFIYCPLFIIIYNLAGNLSNDIYLPTLPALMNEFNVTNFLVQFTMTIWFIGVALPQIYFGLIADRFGCRPLILLGGIIFLSGTGLCMMTSSIYLLVLGRFLQGIGVSSLNIATFATVRSPYYEEKMSVQLISWINITGSLAPLIGPVLGSYLYSLWGWRSTFCFVFALGCVALIGLYFFMMESTDKEQKLKFKINFQSSLQYYKPIYSNKKLWIPVISYTCFLAALIAYLTSAPFVMYQHFHIDIKYFGLTQLVPFMTYIGGGMTANRLVNNYRIKEVIILGLIIIFLSFCYFMVLSFYRVGWSIYHYIFAISIFLYGFALAGSPLITQALSSSENKGGAAAILGLSMAVMASLGSLTMAVFYQGHFTAVSFIIGAFIFLGVFNYFFMLKKGAIYA